METERLILDRVKETDKEDYFHNISHDKKVLETFVCRYADSLEDFDFTAYLGRDDLFAIRLKDTGRLIGIILYFDEQDGVCEIGYGIGSEHWGQGYAAEAVGRFLKYLLCEKGLHTVCASYFTGNDASRRVMEKCGMAYDRFSEKELTYLGVERDLTYYAIRKEPSVLLLNGPSSAGKSSIAKALQQNLKNAFEGCIIRREKTEERRAVENLVRESFWNVYRPGCSEHYVIHVLRDDPAFVKELDFVMEKDGRLIGQNMFMRTGIDADDGRVIPVLTMGPIGITPELKRQGYGKHLLDFCLEKATAMGVGAVLFEGNIGFYGHSGFTYARTFGIRYHDLPEGADDSFFLCRELIPGYLDGITGVYQTPTGYYVDDADVEEFDKTFPPKEKLRLPGQIF